MAIALMVVGVVFGRSDVRALALMVCGIAMTATIRSYLIGLGQQVKAALRLTRMVGADVRSLPNLADLS